MVGVQAHLGAAGVPPTPGPQLERLLAPDTELKLTLEKKSPFFVCQRKMRNMHFKNPSNSVALAENLNNRGGKQESSSVGKYNFTWTTEGFRYYPNVEGLYGVP